MTTYHRKTYTVQAEKWDGSAKSEAAIAALVGKRYQLRSYSTELRISGGGPHVSLMLSLGGYAVVGHNEPVEVFSGGAFESCYELPPPLPKLVVKDEPKVAPKPVAKPKVTTKRQPRSKPKASAPPDAAASAKPAAAPKVRKTRSTRKWRA